MVLVNHYVPSGHTPMTLDLSNDVELMMLDSINKGNKLSRWTSIPDTQLEIRLKDLKGATCLVVRKEKIWVYANVFCLVPDDFAAAIVLASKLCWKYGYSLPFDVDRSNWICTIPIHDPQVTAEEMTLIGGIAAFIYQSIIKVFKLEDIIGDDESGNLIPAQK
jgi:hypothetical protein